MASNTALRGFRSLTSTICTSCRRTQPLRPFSQSTKKTLAAPSDRKNDKPEHTLDSLMSSVDQNFRRASPEFYSNLIPGASPSALRNLTMKDWEEDDLHKLHIYATKHNTHLTLSKPNRDALISVSCGNIGFRKAGRGTYDAGYQLAAFVMSRVIDKGLLPQIKKLELIYRGFGPGREAVTKAILGSEGKRIRPLIVKLSDSTRLKFGGVRSKKPRRLG
ncbi:mitochondrial ribosomal protein-like protein subunit S18 [Cucurbitaria berberidis CBS 394.84]|uniref:Small ribosomal subunit protein uS11m n=1 Tax=Cucurbitaria berberidis CBS 394.84 TaxID=1168544 RepID=A0A9P4L431_9PLEO|nr:mitochondrial ribosomal protein-like protein subunit S18 [Cucurbitaria berberidis CBS 394.84]KAF1840919.1 mitochondrial ribosomal protein-like protein subunit S18 [Cucurbitaria berberidis CBS 394.84]